MGRNPGCTRHALEFRSGAGPRNRRLWSLLLAHLHGRRVGDFFHRSHCPHDHARGPALLHHGAGRLFPPHGLRDIPCLRHQDRFGGTTFNASEVVGNALEAGLSTAYYPPEERGLSQTALNFGTQMESAVLNHVFQEFWPDIRRKVFRQKNSPQTP